MLSKFSFLLFLGLGFAVPAAPPSDHWVEVRASKEKMPGTRSLHGAVALGTQVVIAGGFQQSRILLYDTVEERFEILEAQKELPYASAIALDEHRALFVNGRDDCLFDLRTRRFTPLKQTFNGEELVHFPKLIRMPGGTVFACGGYMVGDRPLGSCAVYREGEGFEKIGALSTPRALHVAEALDEERVLIAGGSGADRRAGFNTAEVFNIKTGQGRPIAGMRLPRVEAGSIRLDDGRVLIAGGHNPRRIMNALVQAEVFDPATSSFSPVGSLALARFRPQLAQLPSGEVAVLGGAAEARLIELFDPEENTFRPAESLLLQPRPSGFTLTAMADGRLLLLGGRLNREYPAPPGVEWIAERPRPAPPPVVEGEDPREALVRQLGDAAFDRREEAMRKLSELGLEVHALLTRHQQHSDPEIRMRVGRLLLAFTKSRPDQPWCIEYRRGEQVLHREWVDSMSEGAQTRHTQKWLLRFAELKDPAPDRLVLRFPSGAEARIQALLMNHAGKTRVPVIRLGRPVAGK